jgi:hypothetical protein
MTDAKDVLLTVKVDKALDRAIQKTVTLLGYKSKAELAREALREFLIRRKLYNLFGGEIVNQSPKDMTAKEALEQIRGMLQGLSREQVEKEITAARDEVARELLGDES